jgi:uncharacterized protein YyaL (SSP411 family)
LVLRLKDDYDGAEPSGNSVMAQNLLRLARITGREEFRSAADRTLAACAQKLQQAGMGLPQMLVALETALSPPMEIVLSGPRQDPAMLEMLRAMRRRFLPHAVVMMESESPRPMPALDGRPTVYVCENYACQLPVSDAAALENLLSPTEHPA